MKLSYVYVLKGVFFTVVFSTPVFTKWVTSCSDIINRYKTNFNHTVRDCTVAKDGSLVWRIEDLLQWTDALTACQKISGGDLISVHDFDGKALLSSIAPNNQQQPTDIWLSGVWIGLVRKNNDCSNPFVWSDGSSVDYVDWLPGEPSCGSNNEKCVQLLFLTAAGYVQPGWNDMLCSDLMKSICKLSKNGQK